MTSFREPTYHFPPCRFAQPPKISLNFYALTRGHSPGLFGREWIETTSSLVCDQGGRTIHIHFAVSDSAGNSRVISQFCFADTLTKEICTTHEYYSSRGEQDTTLAGGRDSVFPRSGYESFMLATQQNADGTMLAYHTIQIA